MTASEIPFWKRKRWIAAAVLWLVFSYFAALGPIVYSRARGWISKGAYLVFVSQKVLHLPFQARG